MANINNDSSFSATEINGIPIDSSAPTNSDILIYNSSSNLWSPGLTLDNLTVNGNYNGGALSGPLVVSNATAGYPNLFVTGDDNGTGPGQLRVAGKTNSQIQLLVGVNTNLIYGSVQAYLQGTGVKMLCLNAQGGNVAVNQNTANYPLDVFGTINTSSGILLPSSGGVSSLLSWHGNGSLSVTGSNPGTVALLFTYERIGNTVTVTWPNYLQTLTAGIIQFASVLPSSYCPTNLKSFMCYGLNNSVYGPTLVQIANNGTIDILTSAGGSFTAGSGGITAGGVSYIFNT